MTEEKDKSTKEGTSPGQDSKDQPVTTAGGDGQADQAQFAPVAEMTTLMNGAKEVLLQAQAPSQSDLQKLQDVENLVKSVCEKVASNQLNLTEDQSKFLYKNLIPEIILKAVALSSGANDSKLAATESLISSFVSLLATLVKSQEHLDDCFILMEKMQSAFDFKKSLYTKFRQNVEPLNDVESVKDDVKPTTIDMSKFKLNIDKNWRLNLDIGQDVDILKQDKARKLQIWTMGTITEIKDRNGKDISKEGKEYKKDENGNLIAKFFTVKYYKDVSAPDSVEVTADSDLIT